MPSPSALSIEARKAAWDRLWRVILLADPPSDSAPEPTDEPDPADEESEDEAA